MGFMRHIALQMPRKINKGSIGKACNNKNNITGKGNGNQCLRIVGAKECAPGKQDSV